MTKEEIIAYAHSEYLHAKRLYKITFPMPTIGFYEKTGIAGKAYSLLNRIEFNIVLAEENSEEFKNTITHELAHLIADCIFPNKKQAHGPEFKSIMRDMGADPSTYHKYDVSSVSTKRLKTRYIYTCKCAEPHELTSQSHMKSMIYTCKKCKSNLSFTGEVKTFR